MHQYKSTSLVVFLVTACFLLSPLQETKAQWSKKWLAVGSLHHQYQEGGGWPEIAGMNGLKWPGIMPYSDMQKSKGLWIAAKNVTAPNGTEYPVRIAHIGPRFKGQGEMFPQRFDMISRFEDPTVEVDGLQSFLYPTFVDEVDPSMEPARQIVNVINTIVGITVERRILQFSQFYHDNYHVIEYTFTNTGNVDGDADIEVPDQTLEGVQFGMIHRYGINSLAGSFVTGGAGWGNNTMVDAVGDGMQDYDVNFRAQYAWHGYRPGFDRWNNIGAPVLDDSPGPVAEGDTMGRLTAGHFIGRVILHADERAHQEPGPVADDPGQPSTMTYYDTDDPLTSNNSAFNIPQMQEEYQLITQGRVYPHHADLVEPEQGNETWQERFATAQNEPSRGAPGGWGFIEGFGPYTLEPGESVRIVIAEAADGLSLEAKREIGRKYKQLWEAGHGEAPIDYDANGDGTIGPNESMSKNMWVMTSRDSLFRTFERALANYHSNYSIPTAPLPPKQLSVMSGIDQVSLDWEPFSDASPTGYEVYRAEGRRWHPYELIAEVDAGTTSYNDADVQRGINYYYYVVAVGRENQDGTGNTPTGVTLKSNRYYTQTYDPAFLKREPGESLKAVRVVPNPYNLGSEQSVRWPDQQDRIGFLEVPGQSTIRIYTETGELLETIEHTDGSGDAYWDLTTYSNQVVASGIYFAIIENNKTGEQITRQFAIIR